MFFDGSDQKVMCLQDVFDTVSVSRNGDKLAWDTKSGNAIMVSGVDGTSPVNAPVPLGSNAAPSLSPDGTKIAFLHSPENDGKYDIWVRSTTASDAEQETNTRNVSDVVWSPTGDWLAYVQNWSDQTLEGQISLIRPNGDDAHTLVPGDAPDWSPDGKKLVYVHNGSIWTVNADGTDAAPADPERPRAGLVARRPDDRLHARREVLAEHLPRALLPRVRERNRPAPGRPHVPERAPGRLAPGSVRVAVLPSPAIRLGPWTSSF